MAIFLSAGVILYYRYKIVGFFWISFKFKKTSKFETEISQLDTPMKVQAYMDRYFKYTKDVLPEDRWKPAKKTWKEGKGDCEDYAIFAVKCLYHLNVEIFCMYRPGNGHATTLIKNGNFVTIGTYGYKNHSHKSYSKLAEHWYKDWDSYSRYDKDVEFIESVSR